MRISVCHCFSSSQSPHYFLRGQVEYMTQHGCDITIVVPDDGFVGLLKSEFPEATIRIVPIRRKISPFKDLLAIYELFKLFRKCGFDIIHLHTPKASLLGVLAARLLGHKNVLYHLHGLVSLRLNKLLWGVTLFAERLPLLLSRYTLCVSHSMAEFCVENNLIDTEKIGVIANGSANGVECRYRFNPKTVLSRVRDLKRSLHLEGKFVVGFLGRMAPDKGLTDIYSVAQELSILVPNFTLLLVGPNEMGAKWVNERNLALDGVPYKYVARTDSPEIYLALFDVLLFPSLREGFGLVLAEASAMEIPVVAYDIVGVRDAVRDMHTGVLVEPGQVDKLISAIKVYYDQEELRLLHGKQGREWVKKRFSQIDIWRGQLGVYRDMMRDIYA